MVLALAARCLHHDGMEYTPDNIGPLLERRHAARKIRRGGGKLKGPKKRGPQGDQRFAQSLEIILGEMNT